LAFMVPTLGPISLWYGGGFRFRGWSENPNQMALAVAAMPFFGWWFLQRSSSLIGKIACAVGIALCMVAGIATKSDGLRVAWVVSSGVIGLLMFYRVTARGRSRWLHISHVVIPVLLVMAVIFFGDELVARLSGVAEGIYAEGDQGEKRFTLWAHGLQAIAASPLFGFGPGAYSGYDGPFESFEAHNSFIDWGMSTGLAGILMYVALLGWITWQALRSRNVLLVGMVTTVIVASVFGYLLRHPDFWMVLVLVLILSERAIAFRERQADRSPREPRARSGMATPESSSVY
jgi:O-antigen ligase